MKVELRIRRLVIDESLAGRDQAEPVMRAVLEELSRMPAVSDLLEVTRSRSRVTSNKSRFGGAR
jgi:hypothetical protein